MEKILSISAGVVVGLGIGLICQVSGLQNRHLGLLYSLTTITGGVGASVGLATANRYRHLTRQRAIAQHDIDRAIGAISERYALTPTHQQVLIALQELRGELTNGL